MSVGARPCFLIDSLLEKAATASTSETTPEDIKGSPSTSSGTEWSRVEEESEGEDDNRQNDETQTKLSQLISNMMKNNQNTQMNMQPQNTVRNFVGLHNPVEYFSKLQMMQHAFNMSALALRHQQQQHQFQTGVMHIPAQKDGFVRPIGLLNNVRSTLTKASNVKKYRCDICEKTFSRSNTLITHKRIHTGEKPFKCDHCGRAFRQPGNLTRHRLTHTTVKPYVCAHCDKAFNRASNLHTHMRTHNCTK